MKIKNLLLVALLGMSANALADEFKVADVNIEAGKQVTVDVELVNPSVAYCIATVDLMLPEGIKVASTKNKKGEDVYTKTCTLNEDRIEDHTLTVGPVEGGYRFLAKSDTNSEFYEKEGALFTVTLEAAETVSTGEYTAKLIADGEAAGSKLQVCCDAKGNQYFLKDVEFKINVNNATGIRSIGAEDSNATIYNLNGQVVKKAGKGLYIQNGKKVVVK